MFLTLSDVVYKDSCIYEVIGTLRNMRGGLNKEGWRLGGSLPSWLSDVGGFNQVENLRGLPPHPLFPKFSTWMVLS